MAENLGTKVGGIYYEVDADTTKLIDAQRRIEKFTADASNALSKGMSVGLNQVSAAAGACAISTGLASDAAKIASREMDGMGGKAQKAADHMRGLSLGIREAAKYSNDLSRGIAVGIKGAMREVEGIGEGLSRGIAGANRNSDIFRGLTAGLAGVSREAKQVTNAMRGVPAQFTDIAVSLQAGQNPLQVFLQQGGQLKDMFGGITPAFRALGSYVAGLVNPFTVAAAAVGVFVFGLSKAQSETNQLVTALGLTGNASRTTSDNLMSLAEGLDNVSGITRGKAVDALAAFASLGVKASAELGSLVEASINLERLGGDAVEETARKIKALGDDPLKATQELNKQYNFLTESTYRQAKAAIEQGDATEAARIISESFANTINARTPQIEANLGTIEQGWYKIKRAAAETLEAILSIGRQDSKSKIQAQQEIIDQNQKILDNQTPGFQSSRLKSEAQKRIDVARGTMKALQMYQDAADKEAADTERTKFRMQADADASQYKTRQQRKDAAIAKETATIRNAYKGQIGMEEKMAAEIAERKKQIEEYYKEPAANKAPDLKLTPAEKFDSEAYLASLQKRSASEIQIVDQTEAEKLRINDKRLKDKQISVQEHKKAITLIQAEAAAERQKFLDEGLDEATSGNAQRLGRRSEAVAAVDPVAAIREEEAAKLEEINNARALDMEFAYLYDEQKVELARTTAERIAEIEKKKRDEQINAQSELLTSYSGLFGELAGLAEDSSGRQSSAFRALFAVAKGFAIADSVLKLNQAIMQAMADPTALTPAQKFANYAAVASAGAGLIANIRGVNMGGGRRYGGPTNAGSLYRVNESGRPEMFTASNGNQYMMPTANGRVTAADKVGGGSVVNVVVNNNHSGASVDVQRDNTGQVVSIAINEVATQIAENRGPVWRALRGSTNTRGQL